MNWDDIHEHWPQLKRKARRHWFHLTQDDVEGIGGTREELVACLEERYSFSREEAEKEADAWAFFQALDAEGVQNPHRE